jgi:hypothetical protein
MALRVASREPQRIRRQKMLDLIERVVLRGPHQNRRQQAEK